MYSIDMAVRGHTWYTIDMWVRIEAALLASLLRFSSAYLITDSIIYLTIPNNRFNKSELYAKFISDYQDYKKLSQKRFSAWIGSYAELMGMKYEHGNSNGARWAVIKSEKNTIKNQPINNEIIINNENEELPF